MAPDLNSLGSHGQWRPQADDYEVPDIVLGDPKNRRVKVLSIGAGVSGILMAYQIQKLCKNVEHVIYEKNEDIGGTWLENRYPGCACDIPSHAYTYNFAMNPDWPRFFSYSADIWKYLDKVCDVWGLRKYMTFNTEVVGCYWQEDEGEWLVKMKQKTPDGQTKDIEERCHLLLNGTGILNNYKWPDIKGIEKFKGRVIHTARWPKDYQEEQWKNDRVAVIGSGASSVQTVPHMQPHVKHMDVFVRTGVWFITLAGNSHQNKEYSQEEKDTFRQDPAEMVKHAKHIEDQVNGFWGMVFSGSDAQKMARKMFGDRMAEFIKDERLLKGFTPKWSVGCRRVTPGDPYMLAIQEKNVDVHFTAVGEITEDGVIGEDGVERKCDTIVCATGFDVTYRPRFPLIGRDGVSLADKWKDCPESYLGIAIPEIPSTILFLGPTWPVENGSVMGPLMSVADYAISCIEKLQDENLHSFAPKQSVTDSFNAHVQTWIKKTVWTEDCRAWYKNNETGRVNAVWPGSSLHYMRAISSPRWEDYDMRWHGDRPGGAGNMWAWLGTGSTPAMVQGDDVSPYLAVKNVSPEWLEAIGYKGDLEKALEKDEKILKETLDGRKKAMKQAQEGATGEKQDTSGGVA